MAWRGSVSRSLMSAARSSAFRSSTPLSAPPRLRPSSIPSSRPNSRRLSFSNPRTLGELGCTQSLMPLHMGARLTSHLAVNVLEHIVVMARLVLDDLGTCSIDRVDGFWRELNMEPNVGVDDNVTNDLGFHLVDAWGVVKSKFDNAGEAEKRWSPLDTLLKCSIRLHEIRYDFCNLKLTIS
ncbi:hypothetical protein PHJA_001003700 [Phtheirospermum japonicum]|uniref:Uncharacterized protein n=1 Tax=Phtheirospermum japonicum TaxID=374723 RepID=A0A830BM50_9LAMI|nr:hypothetical protein PHJA_001003700 [Phtheirospermum japonicum]